MRRVHRRDTTSELRIRCGSSLKDTVEFTSAVLSQGGYAYTIVDQATVDRWTDMS